MQASLREALHPLQQGASLRIHGGLGATVLVFDGQVWLTQDGDLRDIFLGAGESFTLDSAAPALLHAVKPAQVMLAGPARDAQPRRPAARAWRHALALASRLLGAPHLHVEHWPARRPALA